MSVEILTPRDVPLGGLRAMTVRRTLPQRQRSLIGAWCFVDHYGPDDVSESGGMLVPPHPHTGLSTVSWLFSGEIEHRDSAGHHAMVRPGEMNLMTAGRGITHSEYSTPETTTLHGAQLWLALPDKDREIEPRFEHYAPEPVTGPGWEARVFIGEMLGHTSPVRTHTPLVGAEFRMSPAAKIEIPVDPTHEFGVLVDAGHLEVNGERVRKDELGYVAPGSDTLTLHSRGGAMLLLIGGEPLGEQIIMWWNFIGRTHEEVVAYREDYMRLVEGRGSERFSLHPNDPHEILPAPALPNGRMRLRG